MKQSIENIRIKSILPFERITTGEISNYIPSKTNRVYLKNLKENIDKNASNKQFDKYCELINLNKEDISLIFSDNYVNQEKKEYPFWIDTLHSFFNFENSEEINKINEELPFYDVLFPLINFSINSIEKKTDKKISKEWVNRLIVFFYSDLIPNSHQVFLDEFSLFLKENSNNIIESKDKNIYYKKFSAKILSEKYSYVFTKYPMLARILVTKTHRNIVFISKLLVRLEKDYEEIENEFKIKLGDLKDILLNAGDKHNGEATVILKFNNDCKIVYKPTDLEITNAYNVLLDWVNDNLETNLKKFKILSKGKYGWMEFVEHTECKTITEIKEYYEKAGIIMGLAYFLSTRDYHFENVIASGNSPVLIDHETIIGPKIKYRIKKDTKKFEHSILESLLLPSDGTKDREICGFGSVIQKKTETIISPKIVNINMDTMKKVPQLIVQNNDLKHIPHLNKIPHYIEDYKEEFKSGFSKLYNSILDNKTFLLSNKSPIYNFENKKIRFLIRNTEVYAKLLMILSKPEYLQNNILYGIKQEALARAYVTSENLNIALLKSEREQMTLSDIPAFYTNTLSDYLILENGEKVDLFEMNAIDSLKSKIDLACVENHNEQIKIIEESLSLHETTT